MWQFLGLVLVGLIIIILVLKLLKVSIKIIIKLIINTLVGLLVIYLLNFIPQVNIPFTWWSGLVVGFLGVPGAIIMLIISFII